MEQLVTSDFKLGIIAGGQLGKMLALAASNWDIRTFILDPNKECPASTICTKQYIGDFKDFETVYNFGQLVDMITFDIENINIDALLKLKKEGKRIHPEPEVLKIIQDKGLQKLFYDENKIPSSPFKLYNNKDEILDAIKKDEIHFPFIQKLSTSGYDGKGVQSIDSMDDLSKLLDGRSVIEEKISIQKELAVIVARNKKGEVKTFPTVEMEFNKDANLVEQLICPSTISTTIEEQVKSYAEKIISTLGMTGILAVEFFLDKNNNVLINEIAPRTHNSGHHTIESSSTSQYEQQLRAIFGFPLGSTEIKMPSVMINLLGEKKIFGKVKYEGLTESMAIEGVKIHIYGKKITSPFRKMGHVTIIDKSIESAITKAKKVKDILKVKSWT